MSDSEGTKPSAKKQTALVVEDNFDSREMFEWTLQDAGFEVAATENGAAKG